MKKLIVIMLLLFATPLYANEVINKYANASYSVMQLRQYGATKEFTIKTSEEFSKKIKNIYEWIVNIAYEVPIQENKEEMCKSYKIFIKALLTTAAKKEK